MKYIGYVIAGSVILAGPATSLAAGPAKAAAEPATDVTEEELIDVLEDEILQSNPAPMMDGRGGGASSIMYPYGGNGVQVDASITKEITPDFVALNAYCDSGRKSSREEARTSLNDVYNRIKTAVGKDGRVRKQGTHSIYPVYDERGAETSSFSANLSIMIRITNMSATMRISDAVEAAGCGVNWDVRLVDTQEFEMSVLDDLATRLNKRKAVFEKLLGKKLNTVSSASLNTWVDGYSSYDPETNSAEATTTLSVSFDIGGRTTLPAPTRRTNVTPKG